MALDQATVGRSAGRSGGWLGRCTGCFRVALLSLFFSSLCNIQYRNYTTKRRSIVNTRSDALNRLGILCVAGYETRGRADRASSTVLPGPASPFPLAVDFASTMSHTWNTTMPTPRTIPGTYPRASGSAHPCPRYGEDPSAWHRFSLRSWDRVYPSDGGGRQKALRSAGGVAGCASEF